MICREVQPLSSVASVLFIALSALLSSSCDSALHGTADEAQDMVAQAITFYDKVGADTAFYEFNHSPAPDFHDRDLYIFVLTDQGKIIAHGMDISLVASSAEQIEDMDGKPFTKEKIATASSAGAWVDYKWNNPVTGGIDPKSSWVVLHDGYIFGVGIYQRLTQ